MNNVISAMVFSFLHRNDLWVLTQCKRYFGIYANIQFSVPMVLQKGDQTGVEF